ncbi:MAG: Bacterial lipid biosynthesis acyltransferase [Acidobacteriota bacterium]|jgi:hypothetical protein|nr:Bacterial lipid biosynthesis acyltransferase [Acidobacteriota bacterium]
MAPLAARHPRLAFSGVSALGSLRNRLSRRWPSPDQVRSLFPQLAPSAASRVAWSIGALEARNRLLVDGIRREGLGPVRPLVRTPTAFAALRPPLVLGFFHVGAVQAIGAAIERLPGPVLVMRLGSLYTPSPPVEVASTEGDDQRRAATFRRALAHLASGGFVVLALDITPGPGLRASCLGRTLELARGPFALARLTGAPLRPMVARWRRSAVEVEVGEALATDLTSGPETRESDLAAAAARWLERYLLESPAELGLGLLRVLLNGET